MKRRSFAGYVSRRRLYRNGGSARTQQTNWRKVCWEAFALVQFHFLAVFSQSVRGETLSSSVRLFLSLSDLDPRSLAAGSAPAPHRVMCVQRRNLAYLNVT